MDEPEFHEARPEDLLSSFGEPRGLPAIAPEMTVEDAKGVLARWLDKRAKYDDSRYSSYHPPAFHEDEETAIAVLLAYLVL